MAGVEASPRENSDGVVERSETPRATSIALVYHWKKNNVFSIIPPLLKLFHEYPIPTLFIAVLVGLSTIPLVVFWSFVALSSFLTFLSFLMVEGTLISLALVLLSIVLFGVICLSFFLSSFLVIMWCSTAAGYSILHSAVSLLDKYLPGVKPKLSQYFTIESPKRKWSILLHDWKFVF